MGMNIDEVEASDAEPSVPIDKAGVPVEPSVPLDETEESDDNSSAVIDELLKELKKLVGLLEDPQPGLFTWCKFLRERLEGVYELIGKLLGK